MFVWITWSNWESKKRRLRIMMIMISLGAKINCGSCGKEGIRADFLVGTNKRDGIYRCPVCGKTGNKEEIERQNNHYE